MKRCREKRSVPLLCLATTLLTMPFALPSVPPSPRPLSREIKRPKRPSPAGATVFHDLFHIVGIAGVKRNGRVDVALDGGLLRFVQNKQDRLSIPYEHIRRVQVFDSTRIYGKSAYAAVLAIGAPGALVLTKRRHVNTMVLDYTNDRGGEAGVVFQASEEAGAALADSLAQLGVAVEHPAPLPVTTGKQP